jgi:hypothetical protein
VNSGANVFLKNNEGRDAKNLAINEASKYLLRVFRVSKTILPLLEAHMLIKSSTIKSISDLPIELLRKLKEMLFTKKKRIKNVII